MNNFNKLSFCLLPLLCTSHAFGMDQEKYIERLQKVALEKLEGEVAVAAAYHEQLKQEVEEAQRDLDKATSFAHDLLRELVHIDRTAFHQGVALLPKDSLPDDLKLEDDDSDMQLPGEKK